MDANIGDTKVRLVVFRTQPDHNFLPGTDTKVCVCTLAEARDCSVKNRCEVRSGKRVTDRLVLVLS